LRASDEAGRAAERPPEGTVADVLAWVGGDPERARRALAAEQKGKRRATLIADLERRGAA
jgi:hypothetical protein